jgi:indolepyruvate ferredoxin oxidoreductase beta subunit
MAQRGGVVVSHLKVGDFSSPLVRPSHADGLLVLSAENFELHRRFLRPTGWAFVNAPPGAGLEGGGANVRAVDADGLARKSGNPMAANLVLLGCALSGRADAEGTGLLFCSPGDVEAALERRLHGKESLLGASLQALTIGIREGTR